MDISVVIPVYNEGEGLYELDRRLKAVLESMKATYEIIYVDDGSGDHSWQVLNELLPKHPNIRLIRFVRNFGQHAAICAGFAHANGEYIVLMDCDLQDEPEVIPRLYTAIREQKVHLVHVKRKNRKEKGLKQGLARLFYRILEQGSGLRFDPEIGSFRILSRFALQVFNDLPEQDKFVGGILAWMNLPEAIIEAKHAGRFQGSSNYSFRSSLLLAEKAFFSTTVNRIKWLMYGGLLMGILGMGMWVGYLIGVGLLGWDLSVSLLSIGIHVWIGGTLLAAIGLVGGYLSRILLQVQNRPSYIIEHRRNFDI